MYHYFLHFILFSASMRESTKCSCNSSPTRGSTRPSWTRDDLLLGGGPSWSLCDVIMMMNGNKKVLTLLFFFISIMVQFFKKWMETVFWGCVWIIIWLVAVLRTSNHLAVDDTSEDKLLDLFTTVCILDPVLQLYLKRRGCRIKCWAINRF